MLVRICRIRLFFRQIRSKGCKFVERIIEVVIKKVKEIIVLRRKSGAVCIILSRAGTNEARFRLLGEKKRDIIEIILSPQTTFPGRDILRGLI
jgi:hypothetical protein